MADGTQHRRLPRGYSPARLLDSSVGGPPEQRTGHVFHQADHPAIGSAMARAIGHWRDYPQDFRYLMLNGMRTDYSWADYLNIYDHIRHR